MENIIIQRNDGYELAATCYQAVKTLKGAIMIAPATGIKRKFYHAFAQYLATEGFGVIAFDNSGIGDSRRKALSKETANLQTWGEQDMPAVLDTLVSLFPNTRYHLVGHSAGGQLVGLMPNAVRFSSMFNVACSSGSLRNMDWAFWFRAQFFMNCFIPLNNLIWGYTHAQAMGMGEPLPRGVASQWRKWCNGQGYVKTAFGKTVHHHQYDTLQLASCWIYATDDDIANHANVLDMISVFSGTEAEIVGLDPAQHSLKAIGHMGFFAPRNAQFWDIALQWFNRFV